MLIKPAYRQEHDWDLAKYGREGSSESVNIDRETFGHRKDQTDFPMKLTLRDISGRKEGLVVATVHDLTARRRAEEQMRQHEAELAHVLRVSTMGEMAASLAHELNQPLNAIANDLRACEAYARAPQIDSGKLAPLLKRAGAEALRAGSIIHHLREFLQKGTLSLEVVDLGSLVREVTDLLRREIEENQVTLRLNLAPRRLPIHADTIQIEQVIVNLIRNAIEAMRNARHGSRVLELETTSTGDGMAELAVRDTGEGISKELAEQMFEPFFTTRAEGLGMGLAISRSILEAHNGRLWIDPQDSSTGATVRFALPLHHEKSSRNG
jgi:two-component system sensor kinase FixL